MPGKLAGTRSVGRDVLLAWWIASSLGLLGCPSDDMGGDGDDSTDAGDDDGDDDDDDDDGPMSDSDDASTSASETSNGSATADTSGDGGSSSTSSGDPSGESSSGTDSTGNEICMIDLPPPAECRMQSEPAGGFAIDPISPAGGVLECDIFLQNCPVGEKCMPYSNDGGGAWNATRCSPIDEDPVDIGGDCTVEGSDVSGYDNCVQGSMCWSVDPETDTGYCLELCSCTPEQPVCNTPNTTCTITNQGVLPLCLNVCNPNDAGSCPENEACLPSGDYFLCAPDGSGDEGQYGDPCQFINGCDPGLFCASAESVAGCAGTGCCSSLCVTGDDDNCAPGQECVAWYADGEAPDECLESAGACVAM
jgi:hypothetical protein